MFTFINKYCRRFIAIFNVAKAIFKLTGRLQNAYAGGKRLSELSILHTKRFVHMRVDPYGSVLFWI